MLAAVLIATASLIGIGASMVLHEPTKMRGMAGPLFQSALRSDTGSTFMQPGYRPQRQQAFSSR
jgi:hypothetical protein